MIKAAAIRSQGKIWTLPKPNRHHNIIFLMNGNLTTKGRVLVAEGEQGFINDSGTFLSRTEAAAEATASGQIKELRWPPYLYSEDLW